MSSVEEELNILNGEIIDPEIYLNVVNHELRKEILHTLFLHSITGPITKAQIADSLDIGYHKMLYQLTNQLEFFWKVDHEKKVRGAREEYITPKHVNTIYCLLGSDARIHILDPLANIFGKVSEVGTRCDKCSKEQIDTCLKQMDLHPCMPWTDEYNKKKQIILMENNRTLPYKPVDNFLICTLIKSLENKPCELTLDCRFHSKHN